MTRFHNISKKCIKRLVTLLHKIFRTSP